MKGSMKIGKHFRYYITHAHAHPIPCQSQEEAVKLPDILVSSPRQGPVDSDVANQDVT